MLLNANTVIQYIMRVEAVGWKDIGADKIDRKERKFKRRKL